MPRLAQGAKLLQNAHAIELSTELDDRAVSNAVQHRVGNSDLAPGGTNPLEITFVCSMPGPAPGNPVILCHELSNCECQSEMRSSPKTPRAWWSAIAKEYAAGISGPELAKKYGVVITRTIYLTLEKVQRQLAQA